jgi:acetyltransferase-like isoleucine patch superfamily enzyme
MIFIHSSAEVQTKNIGDQTKIWQSVVILEKAVIGKNCNINCFVFIENDVIIGDNVTVKSGVQLWDGIRVADNVFIGPNATFTNDRIPRSKNYPPDFNKTLVGKGASIGANATILPGLTIGAYSFIGAGSVVTKNTPAYTVWYGNPAVHKGYITENGILLDMEMKDLSGKQYRMINGILK